MSLPARMRQRPGIIRAYICDIYVCMFDTGIKRASDVRSATIGRTKQSVRSDKVRDTRSTPCQPPFFNDIFVPQLRTPGRRSRAIQRGNVDLVL